jgi:hypothetical protein
MEHIMNEATVSGGGSTNQSLRDDLLLELAEEVETFGGGLKTISRVIARRLVERALAGDVPAIRVILDRIDGKPFKATQGKGHSERVFLTWHGTADPYRPDAAGGGTH